MGMFSIMGERCAQAADLRDEAQRNFGLNLLPPTTVFFEFG